MNWKVLLLTTILFATNSHAEEIIPKMDNDNELPKKNYDIGTALKLASACRNVINAELGKEYDERFHGLCLGYIRGVKDSYDVQNINSRRGGICFPKNATWLQLIGVFTEWVDKNTSQAGNLAWTGVITSWAEKYNCNYLVR